MARNYRHIQQYEQEIKEKLEQEQTHREIGETLSFSKEQVKGFLKRLHVKDRKPAAGEAISKKGRSAKDNKYTQADNVSELKYMLARKDAKIKQLEVKGELMQDFLSLTGRK